MLSLSVNLLLAVQLIAAACSAVLAVIMIRAGLKRFCSMLTLALFLIYIAVFFFTDHKSEAAALYTLWCMIYLIYITIAHISQLYRYVSNVQAIKMAEDEYAELEESLKIWMSQKRYCEYDKSREEIAEELNTTKECLHHYFLNKKGVDFNVWRTELRIEEAKKMLIENTDIPINIIGELAGFSDRSNFHRQFVKLVGCSPKQWRDSGGKL